MIDGRVPRGAAAMMALAIGCVTGPAGDAPPDRSLDTAGYVERGLPPADPAWGVREVQRALELLETIAAEDPALLPRFGSARSGEVFDRILSSAVRVGALGGDGQALTLPGYAPGERARFDRERVETRRAVADGALRVVEDGAFAAAEVASWLAEPEPGATLADRERLQEIAAGQRRIVTTYARRVLRAVGAMVEVCRERRADPTARAAARGHADRIGERLAASLGDAESPAHTELAGLRSRAEHCGPAAEAPPAR